MTPAIQKKIERFYKLKDNPSLALFEFIQEIEKELRENFQKEVEEFKSKMEKEVEALIEKKAEQKIQERIFAGISQLKGDKGDPGEPAYTPVKGKDYFTKEEMDNFVKIIYSLIPIPKDGKDGMTPVAGVDYPIKKQIEREIRQLVSAIEIPEPKDGRTPVKGIDYFTNKDIKEVLSKIDIGAKTIRNKLESLKGNERINALAIKNLPETISKEARGIVSAAVPGYVARIARRAVSFIWEEPSGDCNGSNTTFTLPYVPYNPNALMFFINGQLMKKDDDYTIDGKIITTTTAPPTGSVKWAFFRK